MYSACFYFQSLSSFFILDSFFSLINHLLEVNRAALGVSVHSHVRTDQRCSVGFTSGLSQSFPRGPVCLFLEKCFIVEPSRKGFAIYFIPLCRFPDAATALFHYRLWINEVFLTAWFPPHTLLEMVTREINLPFIIPEIY